ncbi:MAG: acyltransferase family protein, partial [Pseudomonadota bacterium]
TQFADARLAQNLPLLADFVLLVAGFIVARAHRDQLAASRRVGRYLFARTGRLLPIHAACLAAFLAVDQLVALVYGHRHGGEPSDYLATLALVQVFVGDAEIWNAPSWIVAVELHMSYLFAALCMTGFMAGPRGRAVVAGAVVAAIAVRMGAAGPISPAADLLLRGAAAFLLGSLLFSFVKAEEVTRCLRRAKKRAGGLLELWALASMGLFLALSPADLAPLAPVVFWYSLLIFVRKICSMGEALTAAPLQRLGDLSYSIILSHALLIHPLAGLVERLGEFGPAVATVLLPVYLILAIALAEVAFRAVELPTRKAMWTWADRAFPTAERDARAFAGDEQDAEPDASFGRRLFARFRGANG